MSENVEIVSCAPKGYPLKTIRMTFHDHPDFIVDIEVLSKHVIMLSMYNERKGKEGRMCITSHSDLISFSMQPFFEVRCNVSDEVCGVLRSVGIAVGGEQA